MKKLNLFSAICALVLFNLSCQKEPDFGEELVTNKIRTYTEEVNSPVSGYIKETFEVRYDQHDRIVGLESTTTPGNKFVYTYSDNDEFTLEIYGANVLVIRSRYFLNDFGFPDSTFQTNNEGDTSTAKYFYNANRQATAMWDYDYTTAGGSQLWNITEFSYDGKGRLIEESDNYSITTYEYETEIAGRVILLPAFMLLPPDLPTKTIYTSAGESYTIEHTYSFDSDGRLIREETAGSDGSIVVKSYTYW